MYKLYAALSCKYFCPPICSDIQRNRSASIWWRLALSQVQNGGCLVGCAHVQKNGSFNDSERTFRAMSCLPVRQDLLCSVGRQNFAIFAKRSFSTSLRNVTRKGRKRQREREIKREKDRKENISLFREKQRICFKTRYFSYFLCYITQFNNCLTWRRLL
jgi:hypothetical protein